MVLVVVVVRVYVRAHGFMHTRFQRLETEALSRDRLYAANTF